MSEQLTGDTTTPILILTETNTLSITHNLKNSGLNLMTLTSPLSILKNLRLRHLEDPLMTILIALLLLMLLDPTLLKEPDG
jgi:hypothetical protein